MSANIIVIENFECGLKRLKLMKLIGSNFTVPQLVRHFEGCDRKCLICTTFKEFDIKLLEEHKDCTLCCF